MAPAPGDVALAFQARQRRQGGSGGGIAGAARQGDEFGLDKARFSL